MSTELDRIIARLSKSLLKWQALKDEISRDLLLSGIPGADTYTRNTKIALQDITLILQQAYRQGQISKSLYAIEKVSENADNLLPPGSGLNEVRSLFQEIIELRKSDPRYQGRITGHVAILKKRTAKPEIKPAESVAGLDARLVEWGIPFVNRRDEITAIIASKAPTYYILDGPAGFGKSRVLEALKHEFSDRSYVCGYAKANANSVLTDIIRSLLKDINPDLPVKSVDEVLSTEEPRIMAELFCQLLRNYYFSSNANTLLSSDGQTEYNGVVLLFDDINLLLDKSTQNIKAKMLLQEFVPAVQESLNSREEFARGDKRFRVITAGRYIASQNDIRPSSSVAVTILGPFTFEFVHQTVKNMLAAKKATDETIQQLAAHLLYLTGGHPDCLIKTIDLYKQQDAGRPDIFIRSNAGAIWDIVHKEIELVRGGIPDHLKDIFMRMSVFRVFNTRMLKMLLEGSEIIYEKDATSLGDELTSTYLYMRERRTIRDAITRRLLVLELRHTQTDRFPELCRAAYDLYLQSMSDKESSIWAKECIYQFIQQQPDLSSDPKKREQVEKELYEKILKDVLSVYTKDQEDPIVEIDTLLKEFEEDKDFQFSLNYCFRDRLYSEEPYYRLVGYINNWKSEAVNG